jgi:hypothetical protein
MHGIGYPLFDVQCKVGPLVQNRGQVGILLRVGIIATLNLIDLGTLQA